MNENEQSIDENIKRTFRAFQGVAEALGDAIRPPNDLRPEKKGICVCMGIGTLGIIILNYMHAPSATVWAEVVLALSVAILLMFK